jgi:glutamate-ammonia-ligase adenylyltransferase
LLGSAASNIDWQELIGRLIQVLSSQYLAHLLVSRPALAGGLAEDEASLEPGDFLQSLRDAAEKSRDPQSKTEALRRAWHRKVIEIGYTDISRVGIERQGDRGGQGQRGRVAVPLLPSGIGHLRLINRAQTALAEAALRIAVEIALESMLEPTVDFKQAATELPFTILGLGRLGHAGMDYGSDLDLLVAFDDRAPWPPNSLDVWNSPQEFYAKLTSQLIRVLSSITREGSLYRIDLRLRPEGKSGPAVSGLESLVAYITTRASAWEHSAYLKTREVAGCLSFGERARKAICDASFGAASRNRSLREELREIRARLLREKARGARPNIKWGPGGMTDVYFVTRYLQLRDRIYFPPERGTMDLITHLGGRGALDSDWARALFEGYSFLRQLDHWIRLLSDRPSTMLPTSQVALRDITRALGLSSLEELQDELDRHTHDIHHVYEEVFE